MCSQSPADNWSAPVHDQSQLAALLFRSFAPHPGFASFCLARVVSASRREFATLGISEYFEDGV
jgi:hypothetical protein